MNLYAKFCLDLVNWILNQHGVGQAAPRGDGLASPGRNWATYIMYIVRQYPPARRNNGKIWPG